MNRPWSEIEKELQAPLSSQFIATRQQSGRSLSYIEGHHAIREANRIFNFGGWNRETHSLNMVQCEQVTNNSNKQLWYTGYTCACTITVGEVSRTGYGFGQGQDSDLGRSHESALKEAETDAMKRALMTFGDQFGLALYDKTQAHVEKAETPSKSQASVNAQAPAKNAVAHQAKHVSDWLGKILTGKPQFDEYTLWCKNHQQDWVSLGLEAEEEGCKNYDELFTYITTRKAA
jgi:DNA recombination protein Rad52